jgi:hypothetical protein
MNPFIKIDPDETAPKIYVVTKSISQLTSSGVE